MCVFRLQASAESGKRLVAEMRADARDVSLHRKSCRVCVGLCVCECELEAIGVALSQIDKHNTQGGARA